MSETLPRMLKYSQIKPKGIPTKMKRIEINQLNNQAQLNFNDIIRFQFQTDQFIDPYSAYIEVQVEIPQTSENTPSLKELNLYSGTVNPLTNDILDTGFIKANTKYQDFQNLPLYILDGPSTSLISEMTFYSNGREIERIDEYDQLGQLVADIGIDQSQRQKGGYYGLASSFGKSDYSYLTHQMQNNSQTNNSCLPPIFKNYATTSQNVENAFIYQHQNQGTSMAYGSQAAHLAHTPTQYQVNSGGLNSFSFGMFNTPVQYKSPINDYLDIAITSVQSSPNNFVTPDLNTNVTTPANSVWTGNNPNYRSWLHLNSNLQYLNFKELSQKYNRYPGLFPINQNLSYFDTLDGRTNNDIIYARNQALLPKQYINYAREFALQDGQYGIEHYDTVSTTPYAVQKLTSANPFRQVNVDTSGIYTDNPSNNQFAYDPVSSITLNNNDQVQYNNNQNVKRRKRILYNNASNQNNFTYWAPGIAQQRWKDGKPVTEYNIGGTNQQNINKELKYGTTKKTLYIPLLSGVLGHLIPNDQWKLIPGKGCGNMTWEFRLNRFAIFMSGHKKNDGTTNQVTASEQFHNGNTAREGWTVKKISMHFDIWDFEPSIHQMVDQQLKEGIIMNSQAFLNGPTYSISQTAQLKGSWQVNNSVQSVKNIFFWFLLDDYMKYNFCRKQFRISHNLRSVQLKLGTEYIPEQPIVGHAGNLIEYNQETEKDVTPFYTELLRTQGEFLNGKGKCQILPQNFIPNERAYDVDNQIQSQFQTAFLHETRLVGKALYCVNLEPDSFDYTYLSGKNISNVRPVELVLDVHSQGGQTRPSTMYVLIQADSIVSFTDQGIQIAV